MAGRVSQPTALLRDSHCRATAASAMIQDAVKFLWQLGLSLAEHRSQAGVADVLSLMNFLLMSFTNQR
jgi:hypothetical protein